MGGRELESCELVGRGGGGGGSVLERDKNGGKPKKM